jgi:hypothetical protein
MLETRLESVKKSIPFGISNTLALDMEIQSTGVGY